MKTLINVPKILTFSLLMSISLNSFAVWEMPLVKSSVGSMPEVIKKQLIQNSQISYRAEGGFSKAESYGVIISCVDGKVSTLTSIYDPRFSTANSKLRKIGSMSTEDYLDLWASLNRQALFQSVDAPEPKKEQLDEFTVTFFAKIGDDLHNFKVKSIKRPEASRYFALQNLIDRAAQMQVLWQSHKTLSQQLEVYNSTTAINHRQREENN
ncbi:MAG: hypothetical protein ACKVQC_08995 [Elusimicrobiota bacterium]